MTFKVIPDNFAAKYAAAIPECCELRTFNAHAEALGLCSGIMAEIRDNTPPTPCGMCEYNTDPEAERLRKEYRDQQLKRRMWAVLSG